MTKRRAIDQCRRAADDNRARPTVIDEPIDESVFIVWPLHRSTQWTSVTLLPVSAGAPRSDELVELGALTGLVERAHPGRDEVCTLHDDVNAMREEAHRGSGRTADRL